MGIFKNQNETAYVGGKKHWTDVIKNTGSGELLLWRQPEEDFNTNSTLVVMPGEEAIFIKGGRVEQVFENGTYKLSTENYPFISRLKNAFSGGVSTFNCVVYFVRKAHTQEIKWGTDSPIQVRDRLLGIATKISDIMNTNSNSYTIIYASIMVVIVAFLLAFVSSSLKEKQYQNVEQDTKKQILAALNVYDVKDVNAEYDKYVKEDDLMQADGSLVKNDAAFQTSYKGEIANGRLHVFVCDVDGQTKYVLPIYGAGLWGPIWGYIALNDDKDTVYGVYFSHQGETPGLGAEITTTKFQDQFLGKHVMENGTVALGVEKHGKVAKPDYQVDGISGGTITSKGVDAMIKDCLSMYNSFLTNK